MYAAAAAAISTGFRLKVAVISYKRESDLSGLVDTAARSISGDRLSGQQARNILSLRHGPRQPVSIPMGPPPLIPECPVDDDVRMTTVFYF